jgi:hypothetical protein
MMIKRTLLLFSFAVALFLFAAPRAQAQIQCDSCDPYASYCDDECWYCRTDYQDGYCPADKTVYTTCGDYSGTCLTCAPAWSETSRTNIGTYGTEDYGWSWNGYPEFACEHHRVDSVTYHDVNQCNLNSAYWNKTDCEDTTDYWSGWQSQYQYCCGYPLSCNNYHSCS